MAAADETGTISSRHLEQGAKTPEEQFATVTERITRMLTGLKALGLKQEALPQKILTSGREYPGHFYPLFSREAIGKLNELYRFLGIRSIQYSTESAQWGPSGIFSKRIIDWYQSKQLEAVMERERRSREYWEDQLSEYWDGGLSIVEYCELKDLQRESARRWIRRLEKERGKETGLELLEVKNEAAREVKGFSGIRLKMENWAIELDRDFEQTTLLELLDLFEGR